MKSINFQVLLMNSAGCVLDNRVGGVVEGPNAEQKLSEKIKQSINLMIADSVLCVGDNILIQDMN